METQKRAQREREGRGRGGRMVREIDISDGRTEIERQRGTEKGGEW